jgi:hypothetical protein
MQNGGNPVFGPNHPSPAAFDHRNTCDPSVIKVRDTYFMYYGANDADGLDADGDGNIGVASSTNGINWTRLNNGQLIVRATLWPGDPGFSNLGGIYRYGAGEPSLSYVDGLFYLLYTDTTNPRFGMSGSSGNYVLRSPDPLFGTNVEELVNPDYPSPGSPVFQPRTSTNHGTYRLFAGTGMDWQFVDAMDAFAIAHVDGVPGAAFTQVTFKSRTLDADVGFVQIKGEWGQGPGIVSAPDRRALYLDARCPSVVRLQAVRPTPPRLEGSLTDPTPWDLAWHGIDVRTGQQACARAGRQ